MGREADTQRMNANIWIVQQGPDFWKQVLDWASENVNLSYDEKDVIRVAANMYVNRKPPTERQAAGIVKIYNRLVDNGFDGPKY